MFASVLAQHRVGFHEQTNELLDFIEALPINDKDKYDVLMDIIEKTPEVLVEEPQANTASVGLDKSKNSVESDISIPQVEYATGEVSKNE
jgi:hypothetical protein